MNTLRSTERHLTLLALNRKIKCGVRAQNLLGNSRKTNNKPRISVSHYSRYTPKIKLYTGLKDTQARALTTTAATVSIEKPFYNPAKPGPGDIKNLIAPSIIPLTAPRFPFGSSGKIPSVTKILSATMPASSKFLLDRWKESMIKKLGIEGFNQYQADTFERGRALHALLANYLLGRGEPVDGKGELSAEVVTNLWKSIQNVVRDKLSNVRLVEHIVTHPTMNYRGIVDCVAFYEDELVVIDFKTAEKHKKSVESLFDNPLQVAAYCGAINNDLSLPRHVIDRNISSGVVIVAYIDGSEATTYHLKPDKMANGYWKQWLQRLDQYSRLEMMTKQEQVENVKKFQKDALIKPDAAK